MLKAYLDLSSTDREGVTAVAGYVATADEWEEILRQWDKRLHQWKLRKFHYKDIQHDTGNRWKQCVGDFWWALENSKVDHVGAALFDADWDKDDWGRDTTVKLASKYHQTLDFALRCLVKFCAERYPGESIDVYSDVDAPETVIRSVFDDLRRDLPSLRSITVGSTERHVALQCADLCTGLLRKNWISVDAETATALPWEGIPFGGKASHFVWSLQRETARLLRAKEGMSDVEIAVRMDVDPRTVRRWLKDN